MESFGRIETTAGESIELTALNVAVYRHMGALALFDHVFITTGESSGIYVWCHEEGHKDMEDAALGANPPVPIHDRLQRVSKFDEENYVTEAIEDLASTDSYPEEWDNE